MLSCCLRVHSNFIIVLKLRTRAALAKIPDELATVRSHFFSGLANGALSQVINPKQLKEETKQCARSPGRRVEQKVLIVDTCIEPTVNNVEAVSVLCLYSYCLLLSYL